MRRQTIRDRGRASLDPSSASEMPSPATAIPDRRARSCDARSPASPRLLIADDDPLVHSTLCAGLDEEFDIVGLAVDADQAIDVAERQQPDVAIIDIEMPGGGGLRATLEIRELAPCTAIVALSTGKDAGTVLAMLRAGAVAYVRKDTAASELRRVLRLAVAVHADSLARAVTEASGDQRCPRSVE